MEGGFVDVYDISGRFLHDYSSDPLGELLLLVHEFHLPFGLRSVNDLRFPIGGSMLYVDLPN